MTPEEICTIYNQGPEAVIAPVEQLYLLIGQQEEQIAHFQQRRSLRKSWARKSGGQPGHRGATLEPVTEPDQILLHEPLQGGAGGSVLHEGAGQLGEERRQIFELPPWKLSVTEHRLVTQECPSCGSQNREAFPEPEAVPARTRYGAGVRRRLTALNQEHLVPSERDFLLTGFWSGCLGGDAHRRRPCLCGGDVERHASSQGPAAHPSPTSTRRGACHPRCLQGLWVLWR
jgi:hypothetical protein